MIALNHILVPHDFGDTSKRAMDYAIAFAQMFDAVLDVVHVRDRGAIFTDILDCCARVLAIQGGTGRSLNSASDPGHGSAPLLVGPRAVRFSSTASPQGARGRWSERWSAWGHAAALSDGHVSQDADRLASTRAWRAAAARDLRSAGTASPVPKYISSGVCPRNAVCGSTWLCSWT